MKQINNSAELKQEITRLKKLSEEKENDIRNQVDNLKEELKPSRLFFSFVVSLIGEKQVARSVLFGLRSLLRNETDQARGGKWFEWLIAVLRSFRKSSKS